MVVHGNICNISLSEPQMPWEVTHYRTLSCVVQNKDVWMNPMATHMHTEDLSVGQDTGHTEVGHHMNLDGCNP